MSDPVRPTFLGIGAHKSGTTWLAEVIRRHPDVFVAHGKEMHYFSNRYDEGPDWYLDRFRGGAGKGAVGECSITYLLGVERTAERIRSFDPDLRLIAILRDPVDRAISHYRWLLQSGRSLPAFIEALDVEPELVSRGLYHRNLKPYWDRFPEESLLLLRYEELRDDPEDLQRRVYAHLGVRTDFVSPLTREIVGQTITPRSRVLEAFRLRAHHAAKRNGAAFLITWSKRVGLSRVYRRWNDRRQDPLRLSPEQRARIYERFGADLEALCARTGWDLGAWSATRASRSPARAPG